MRVTSRAQTAAVAIITGHVAGLAAAHAIDRNVTLNRLDIPALQKALQATDVMVHFDDALIPKDPAADKTPEEDYGHI